MKSILIIEDEQFMRDLFQIQLQGEYRLTMASNGMDALNLFKEQTYDLIILDIMVPYMNGFELCQAFRKLAPTPILMVTARTSVEDTLKGFELGADDYLNKPFDFNIFKARIKSLLRRASLVDKPDHNQLNFNEGTLIINLENKQVLLDQQLIELTNKEFQLLELLATSPERIFTREKLLELLWDFAEDRELRAIDSHVKNIRIKFKKVRNGVKIIQTVWGMGYQLVIPENIKNEEK